MITTDMCKSYLLSRGKNLSDVRKNQSYRIINDTFTGDPAYKRIYILTKEGWKYEDAKYQVHTTPSILKDAVDYYLQFRPKVHYPIGSYVFVPDDNCSEIDIPKEYLNNPFSMPDEYMNQLWIITGRDNSNMFVRYNILQCNWNFKWMNNGEVYKCWGCVRNANSYTSGKWVDEISASLDNLISAWMPDINYVYGDSMKNYMLYDNRTITYDVRFMLTNNIIDPKIYQVTKILDLVPKGIIKLSLKQDELNRDRDNIDLRICDYFTDSGESKLYENNDNILNKESVISSMIVNKNGELEDINYLNTSLLLGKTSYFKVSFTNSIQNPNPEWHLQLNENGYDEKEIKYYEELIKMDIIDDNIISLRPGKAKSIINMHFVLSVSDPYGNYYSSINLEVVE